MKRFLYIIVVLLVCSQYGMGQTIDFPATEYTQDPKANYRLYKTENMYNFIKLDTRTGQMELVQWSVKGNRMSYQLSDRILVSYEEQIPGRFTLYATTNIYQFVLLDQIDGRTWQVQWGIDKDFRWIKPILFNDEIEVKLLEIENDNNIVSDSYKERVTIKIQAIKSLYKKKNLLESTIYQSFRSLVNLYYMQSNNHRDWITMEQACIVLKKIVKGKVTFTREDIENELTKTSSISEIETIFQKYAKRIY